MVGLNRFYFNSYRLFFLYLFSFCDLVCVFICTEGRLKVVVLNPYVLFRIL